MTPEERIEELEAFVSSFKQHWTVSGDVAGHLNVDRVERHDTILPIQTTDNRHGRWDQGG